MTFSIKTSGSTNQDTQEFTAKQIADFLMKQDSGHADDGTYEAVVSDAKDEIESGIYAAYSGGTFLGLNFLNEDCENAIWDIVD